MKFQFVHAGGQEVEVESEFEESAWYELQRLLGTQAPIHKLQRVWGLKVEAPPELSVEAYASIDHGPVQERVMMYVKSRRDDPPITEEIEFALDMKHQTISASVNALVKQGRLRYGENKRQTSSERWASVVETT